METLEKGIYIVSTPIGNLGDITIRAIKILKLADIIICENPKHSLKLLNNLGIKKKLLSLHDYNENTLIKRIEKIQTKSSIALISDAGSPLISDPGYNLIKDYINKNLPITTLPGPTSLVSALQLSGLPIHSFHFYGFVPKNNGPILTLVGEIKRQNSTSVLFISGGKCLHFLNILTEEGIDREISICKEITKKNERVFRGTIRNVSKEIQESKSNIKGEFVIIIKGIDKTLNIHIEVEEIYKIQIKKLLKKFSLTETVAIVHKLTNISKKRIYENALKIKND